VEDFREVLRTMRPSTAKAEEYNRVSGACMFTLSWYKPAVVVSLVLPAAGGHWWVHVQGSDRGCSGLGWDSIKGE
jgi:hypothetical protein